MERADREAPSATATRAYDTVRGALLSLGIDQVAKLDLIRCLDQLWEAYNMRIQESRTDDSGTTTNTARIRSESPPTDASDVQQEHGERRGDERKHGLSSDLPEWLKTLYR